MQKQRGSVTVIAIVMLLFFDGSGHCLAADDDNRKKRLPHQIIGSSRHGMLLKPDIKKAVAALDK